MLLSGKVAVVSGIGPGLGRSVALALAREGADLALGARTLAVLESVADEVVALGRRATFDPTDVARAEDCRRLAERAASELGGIDILVNSAARGNTGVAFEDGDLASWRDAMEVSFFGALQLTEAALTYLVASGDGRIINIGTLATREIQPLQGAYASAKTALLTATKTLATELGPRGIRVNAVNPGYIMGDRIRDYFEQLGKRSGRSAEEQEQKTRDRIALRYIPGPDEIAGSVVFLASDLSRPVTGHVIECNGGMWM